METAVAPVAVGQVVKVLDTSQFQHVVKVGAVERLEWHRGRLYAKVINWGPLVPVEQLVPLKRELQ